jgi:hypothetical protein
MTRTDMGGADNLSAVALIVLLLMLGGGVYLFRAEYIGKRSGVITIVILVMALIALSVWMYTSGD